MELDDAAVGYNQQLQRYLRARTGNEADAADLAQEAYLRLSRVEKPELIRKPEAYLFRIACNLLTEFQLKRAQTPHGISIDDENNYEDQGDGSSFEDSLERRRQLRRLETLMDDLPPLYRSVLILRKRDGYSHREIAEKLKIAPSTVHTYLKRALAHCRAQWTE